MNLPRKSKAREFLKAELLTALKRNCWTILTKK
ncbi:hypothetical protein A0J61_11478 [Choanephora cucurbitarum]|uniref:Uncharacterized protein n=1 Tax=Choanephora cucurbitarum TaxID=101091 RepID=A0A1C7MUF7_9FUNG|nr:hypothetical protein A0J61_11478 [Choanephora cucurbitarum]